jgi:hypothetical protein
LVDIVGATIEATKVKDKFCFEISTAQPGKKGNKKYVFASDKEHERDEWVEKLNKAASNAFNLPPPMTGPSSSVDNPNGSPLSPMHMAAANGGDDEEPTGNEGIAMKEMSIISERGSVTPQELSGNLFKKSPNVMKGWQKRFFKTLPNGDLSYFKSVSVFDSCRSFSYSSAQ